ncbi:hypothetical protein EV127DRAFT_168783 [Xylaria flabelliformis]|nr:hypothetical protein EV127DRAFT_168783 [Xylaria flabelliformis]
MVWVVLLPKALVSETRCLLSALTTGTSAGMYSFFFRPIILPTFHVGHSRVYLSAILFRFQDRGTCLLFFFTTHVHPGIFTTHFY